MQEIILHLSCHFLGSLLLWKSWGYEENVRGVSRRYSVQCWVQWCPARWASLVVRMSTQSWNTDSQSVLSTNDASHTVRALMEVYVDRTWDALAIAAICSVNALYTLSVTCRIDTCQCICIIRQCLVCIYFKTINIIPIFYSQNVNWNLCD